MPGAQCKGAKTRIALKGHRDTETLAGWGQNQLHWQGEQAPAPSMSRQQAPCQASKGAQR